MNLKKNNAKNRKTLTEQLNESKNSAAYIYTVTVCSRRGEF